MNVVTENLSSIRKISEKSDWTDDKSEESRKETKIAIENEDTNIWDTCTKAVVRR